MALIQFLTIVIPRVSVIEKYGSIPEKLIINHTGWERFWESWDGESEMNPDFEDALTIPWWLGLSIDLTALQAAIDSFLPRADWTDDLVWKVDTDVDHDVSIDLDPITNQIADFRFRADLRDQTQRFVKSMVSLCLKNEWLLMTSSGELIEPTLGNYQAAAKRSDAYRFIVDPRGFLEDEKAGLW